MVVRASGVEMTKGMRGAMVLRAPVGHVTLPEGNLLAVFVCEWTRLHCPMRRLRRRRRNRK